MALLCGLDHSCRFSPSLLSSTSSPCVRRLQMRLCDHPGARGAVLKPYDEVRVRCPSNPPWPCCWQSWRCSPRGLYPFLPFRILTNVDPVSASSYAAAYSFEEGYTMTLDSLRLPRKMASRSQRQCPSQVQQSRGTPSLRNHPFRSV